MTKTSSYYLYYQGLEIGLISSDTYNENSFSISLEDTNNHINKNFKATFSNGDSKQFISSPEYILAYVIKIDYDDVDIPFGSKTFKERLEVNKEIVKEINLTEIKKQ